VILALLVVPSSSAFGQSVLDVQSTNFFADTKVELNSGWSFYRSQLLSPGEFKDKELGLLVSPGSWTTYTFPDNDPMPSFGFGTYRIQIVLPHKVPYMGLFIPAPYSSSKVWINGELRLETGHVSSEVSEVVHRRLPSTIPFKIDTDTLEIVIQVANFYHQKGGLVKVPVLASDKKLRQQENMLIMADMIFIGSLAFMGLSFLFMFLLFWQKDTAILYFALFCLCWSYRSLSDGYAPLSFLIPSVNWVWWSKLEYIILFTGSAMGSLFLNKIFSRNTHPLYRLIVNYLSAVFIIATLLLPSQYVTQLLFPFYLLVAINIIYVLVVIVSSALSYQRESRFALITVLLCTVVLMSHVFSFFGQDDTDLLYINMGYIVVFMLLSLLLGMRFSRSFSTLERLQAKTLEQKKEIMHQTEQLSKMNLQLSTNSGQLKDANTLMLNMNKELEEKVAIRTARLESINEELDTFLYRSSHDLTRPIKTIKGLINLSEHTLENSEYQKLFQRIRETVIDMEALLSKLKEIHEIQTHQVKLESTDMDDFFFKLVSGVKTTVQNSAKLNFNLQSPKTMHVDPLMLNQILFELFRNSAVWVDHGNEEITINCAVDDENQDIRIKVSDNGPGIVQELEKDVFEMYKVANILTNSHGLGLYIVSKIVQKCNGVIALRSAVGKGTEVEIIIPYKRS
jgi:signal transduction histidine kinase